MYRINRNTTYDQVKRGRWYYIGLRSVISGKIVKIYTITKTANLEESNHAFRIWKESESAELQRLKNMELKSEPSNCFNE